MCFLPCLKGTLNSEQTERHTSSFSQIKNIDPKKSRRDNLLKVIRTKKYSLKIAQGGLHEHNERWENEDNTYRQTFQEMCPLRGRARRDMGLPRWLPTLVAHRYHLDNFRNTDSWILPTAIQTCQFKMQIGQ